MSTTHDVRASVWSDPWFQGLEPRASYLYLWTLTNPQAHLPGGPYQVSLRDIVHQTRLSTEDVLQAFKDLVEKVTYNVENGWLWVHGRVKNYRRGRNSRTAISIRVQVEACEDPDIQERFLSKYGGDAWLREELSSVIPHGRRNSLSHPNATPVALGQGQGQGQGNPWSTERQGETATVRAQDVPSRVIARFEEAATIRKITVDTRLIGQALADYPQVKNRERIALDCAAWLRENAPKPKSKAEPRSAHLTLRNFLRGAEVNPKTTPGNLRQTAGATDPVEGCLPIYAHALRRTPDELRPVVAGLFAKTGSTPLLPEVHKAMEAA